MDTYFVPEVGEVSAFHRSEPSPSGLQEKRGNIAPYEDLSNTRVAYQEAAIGYLLVKRSREMGKQHVVGCQK
jgi:hypothetical protein